MARFYNQPLQSLTADKKLMSLPSAYPSDFVSNGTYPKFRFRRDFFYVCRNRYLQSKLNSFQENK